MTHSIGNFAGKKEIRMWKETKRERTKTGLSHLRTALIYYRISHTVLWREADEKRIELGNNIAKWFISFESMMLRMALNVWNHFHSKIAIALHTTIWEKKEQFHSICEFILRREWAAHTNAICKLCHVSVHLFCSVHVVEWRTFIQVQIKELRWSNGRRWSHRTHLNAANHWSYIQCCWLIVFYHKGIRKTISHMLRMPIWFTKAEHTRNSAAFWLNRLRLSGAFQQLIEHNFTIQ